jgi:hypothetical protein
MKKISFGLIAILLMLIVCCKKAEPELNCNSPTKNINVSCNSPTSDVTITRDYIIGQWRLERTDSILSGFETITKSRDQLPYTILNFCDDHTYKCSDSTTLLCTGKINYFVNYYGKSVLFFENGIAPYLTGAGHFKICKDSLFLFYKDYGSNVVDQVWSRK